MYYGKPEDGMQILHKLWEQLENEIRYEVGRYRKNIFNPSDKLFNLSLLIASVFLFVFFLFYQRQIVILFFAIALLLATITRNILKRRARYFLREKLNILSCKVNCFGHAIFIQDQSLHCVVRPQKEIVESYMAIPLISDRGKGYGTIDFEIFDTICFLRF